MSSTETWAWSWEHAIEDLGQGLLQLDLGFQGRRSVIAAYLWEGNNELVLIETGPGSTVENLRFAIRSAGFDIADLNRVLVTHIHLDHAGAAGLLARENPNLIVHAHPFGVPHLADPTKLINSASRIYGDQMIPLWGELAPIPASQLVPFEDDQVLYIAGRTLRVLFTPGHAWHHVAFWDPASSTIFTGDVGGIRMPGQIYVCPPTPPPDLDPGAWTNSIGRLEALGARRLCLTHFGVIRDAGYHFDQIIPNLNAFIEMGVELLERGADQETLARSIHERMSADLGSGDGEALANYELATPSYMAAMGIHRYYVKRV